MPSGRSRREAGTMWATMVVLLSTTLVAYVNGEVLDWFVPGSELSKIIEDNPSSKANGECV